MLVIGAFIFCFVSSAAEVDFEINTGLNYDTNINHSLYDPDEGAYLTISPKAVLRLPFNRAFFSSGIRAGWEQHLDKKDANMQELILSGTAGFDLTDHISFNFSDNLDISERLNSLNESTDMYVWVEFTDNRFTPSIKYQSRGRALTTYLAYTNVLRDYREESMDDWTSHSGNIQMNYSFGYKTSAELSVGLGKKSYHRNRTGNI